MRSKIFLVLTCWLGISSFTFAQHPGVPEIGKPFPDIVFHKVINYRKKDFSVSEQKGKWLIIDFWSLGCASCFNIFRKMKAIENTHGDKIQILQVGKKDHGFNSEIESIYAKISSNLKLHAPATYDTVLRNAWGIETYPHIYVVDPAGILRFITDGRDLSADKISALLKGQEVELYPKNTEVDREFDVSFLSNNGHVIMTTLISESTGEAQFENVELHAFDDLTPDRRAKGWIVSMISLKGLYNIAYFGRESWTRHDTALYAKVFPYPILEMNDTSFFKTDFNTLPLKGVYNCFIKLPEAESNANSYVEELKRGLSNTFRYSASVETREVSVWSLVARQGVAEKLRSKGGTSSRPWSSAAGGFVLQNETVNMLIGYLTAHLPFDNRVMFVDATGINTNIDLSIEGDMTDFSVVQKQLAKLGLSFVRQTRTMKVLVLRD